MRHRPALQRSHIIYTIAVMGFIYTLHLVLPLYSNSSFLSLFVSERNVGLIYMTGSAITVLGFLFVPIFIRKAGNYTTCLWLILIEALLMYGLVSTNNAILIAILFALQTAVVALIGFCFDIFLEVHTQMESVGSIRGMYMATINTAWILAALVGSILIDGGDNYRAVYVAALFILVPLFYLVLKNFPRFKDPHYEHPSVLQTLAQIWRNPNHFRLFFVNIILQVFYAWMTVYSALYLHTVMNIDWMGIGIILTVMLLPFALIELPLGKLADKKYGEKEIMIAGFALLGVATMFLTTIHTNNVIVWAVALFFTRVGAAAAEIMIETYFFKTVSAKDPNLLGFFRVTRSLSYFIAPLLAGFVFLFTEDSSLQFIALGVMCLGAIIPLMSLKDTQ
jgi:MFS family permease